MERSLNNVVKNNSTSFVRVDMCSATNLDKTKKRKGSLLLRIYFVSYKNGICSQFDYRMRVDTFIFKIIIDMYYQHTLQTQPNIGGMLRYVVIYI